MGAVAFCVEGALGALGRRFESCRPNSKNPIIERLLSLSFFNLHIMTAMVAVKLR